MNFISGVTMSAEEAIRDTQERDAAQQAAVAAGNEDRGRVGSWGSSTRRRSITSHIPPIPNYNPPAPPVNRSGALSPEQELTRERAEHKAEKTVRHGAREEDVPNRTLKTASAPPGTSGPSAPAAERREQSIGGSATILPVVEEAAEGSSSTAGAHSRNSHISSVTTESEVRPLTPAKDGTEMSAGFGNPLLGGGRSAPPHPTGPPPPTPPKTGYGTNLKPESADSGYGVAGSGGLQSVGGSLKSLNRRSSISRESLDKELPPLPRASVIHEIS
jgi:1-phosphatidylinositol-4-phosphate 5-kinase